MICGCCGFNKQDVVKRDWRYVCYDCLEDRTLWFPFIRWWPEQLEAIIEAMPTVNSDLDRHLVEKLAARQEILKQSTLQHITGRNG